MSKALLINGSPHQEGCTYRSLKEVKDTLINEGIDVDIHWIGKEVMPSCIACNNCKNGKCIYNDEVNKIIDKLDEYQIIIIGSPVYYSGISGQLTSFLNRLFYASKGKMKNKLASAIVNARRCGASSALDQINKYFLMSNMIVVGSQYWNQTYGTNEKEVELDYEGLQTMQVLAKNITWLNKCIELGDQHKISRPLYKTRIKTNFIKLN